MKKIILASGSPRRKELIRKITDNVEITPSRYEEDMTLDMPYENLAMFLAKGKAEEVAQRKQGLVLGVDTFVVMDDRILGKPKDVNDAIKMLEHESDKIQKVVSGICIIDTEQNKIIQDFDVTELKFRKLSRQEIIKYVEENDCLDKAGAYTIRNMDFVEYMHGSNDNVIGLPVEKIKVMLKQNGYL